MRPDAIIARHHLRRRVIIVLHHRVIIVRRRHHHHGIMPARPLGLAHGLTIAIRNIDLSNHKPAITRPTVAANAFAAKSARNEKTLLLTQEGFLNAAINMR